MIGVKLEGRLGNQLFQYAFICAAAKKLNTRFYLDRSIIPFLLPQYFNVEAGIIDRIFSIRGFRSFFDLHLRIAFYKRLGNLFYKSCIRFNENEQPNSQLVALRDNVLYLGFFQSEYYFENAKADIISAFRLKQKYKQAFDKALTEARIPGNYVAIHIRRGDYIDHKWALDFAYYHKALKAVAHKASFFVFVSDEPDLIEKEFNYLPNKYISRNSEIIDFQFLSNAKACILSNSSFSWWGAYLNANNPHIIAPKYWLGFNEKVERPCQVISKKFTTIEVD